MFKELAPLLRHRSVLITVTHLEEDQFRVNVVPKKIADGDNNALTTAVSVSGTVEDLDEQLPQTLVNFVSSHLELKNTLDRAKADMDAAAKAAQAEARNKNRDQAARKDASNVTASKPASALEKPAPQKPEAPKTASLFGSPDESQPSAPAPLSAAAVDQTEADTSREEYEESMANDEDEEQDLDDAA